MQIASKRFLEVVEDLAKSQKTDPNVRQMLYKAFAALAFDYQVRFRRSSTFDPR